jgi:hypothetical protein
MLIVSAFKDTPAGRSQSAIRVIWMIPCIFAASLLASSGENITFDTVNTINTITDNSTATVAFTEDFTTTTYVTLLQPVWATVHILMFVVMLLYVIIQVLTLFVKRE